MANMTAEKDSVHWDTLRTSPRKFERGGCTSFYGPMKTPFDREVPTVQLNFSIVRETLRNIELSVKMTGVRPKCGYLARIQNALRIHHTPHGLFENATVKRWTVTPNFFEMAIQVYNRHRAPYVVYRCTLPDLPSLIDPNHISVEVKKIKGQSRSYVIVRLRKQRPGALWAPYVCGHGGTYKNGTLPAANGHANGTKSWGRNLENGTFLSIT